MVWHTQVRLCKINIFEVSQNYEKYIYPFFRVLKVRKIDNNVLKSYVEFLEKEILKIKKSTGAETQDAPPCL